MVGKQAISLVCRAGVTMIFWIKVLLIWYVFAIIADFFMKTWVTSDEQCKKVADLWIKSGGTKMPLTLGLKIFGVHRLFMLIMFIPLAIMIILTVL